MSELRLATQIGIDRQGLIFEGKRMPFFITADPIEVETSELEMIKVRVTFLADSVRIDPRLTVETDGDVLMVSLGDDNE